MTEYRQEGESNREPAAYSVRYRPGDGPLGLVVVKAVAAATGTPPTELDPLYDTIDPQALQTMYETVREFPAADCCRDGELTFAFGGCTVTVAWTGLVTVRPPDDA